MKAIKQIKCHIIVIRTLQIDCFHQGASGVLEPGNPPSAQNKVKPRGGSQLKKVDLTQDCVRSDFGGPKIFWRAAGAPEKIAVLTISPLEIAIF